MDRKQEIAAAERRVETLYRSLRRLRLVLTEAQMELNRLKYGGENDPVYERSTILVDGKMPISQGF